MSGVAAAAPGSASSPHVNVSVAVYVESAVASVSSNVTENEAPVPERSCGVVPATAKWPAPPVIPAPVKFNRAWLAS